MKEKRKIRVLVDIYERGLKDSRDFTYRLYGLHHKHFIPFTGWLTMSGVFHFPTKVKTRQMYARNRKEALRWIKAHGGEGVNLA